MPCCMGNKALVIGHQGMIANMGGEVSPFDPGDAGGGDRFLSTHAHPDRTHAVGQR